MATRARSHSSSTGRRRRTPELTLHQKQDDFVFGDAQVQLFRGGLASGKTIAGAAKSIARRYLYPGTGQLIGGPSWDQVRDGAMVTLNRLLNPDCVVYENKNDHIKELDNGSWFQFRSLSDPEVLRSLEVHDGWIDELAQCSQLALDIMLGRARLRHDDPGFENQVWGTTTPRGMDWTLDVFGWDGNENWYDVTDEEGHPTGERVLIRYDVTHATIFDNRANLPAGHIERLQQRYGGTPFYEQELLGLYTAFEGLVYTMFRHETHVRGLPCELAQCKRIVVGVDFGGITPTALVLLGERASGRIHQYAECYRVGMTLPDIAGQLLDWTQLAGRQIDVIACDGSEPVAIASLVAAGFRAVEADKDRDTGIKLVQQRLSPMGGAPGLTFAAECTGTIGEFGMYMWASKRDTRTKIVRLTDSPIDHHGDAMDALRYGVMALGQHRASKVVTLPSGRRVHGFERSTAPADARRSPADRPIPRIARPTGL